MSQGRNGNWPAKIANSVGLLLAVAVGAWVAWHLLAPLVPGLVALLVLTVVYALVFGRFRR